MINNIGQKEKIEVLVNKSDTEAVKRIREIIYKINGKESPEYENETNVRFEYFGTKLEGIECMAAGAWYIGCT